MIVRSEELDSMKSRFSKIEVEYKLKCNIAVRGKKNECGRCKKAVKSRDKAL